MSGGFRNPKSSGSSLSAAEILWVQTGNAGVLLLKEQASAPSFTSGYGKIYVKTDNLLYYLNDSGVEVQIGTSTGGNAAYGEVPSGSGTSFTLAHTPLSGTLRLYRGGARQQSGAGNDYTITGAAITLSTSLSVGEILLADYNY